MKFIADLHIHSHYSIATSKNCSPENLYKWACLKGITVVGTGDFTHPGWFAELNEKLEPAEDGLYKLKAEFIAEVIDEIPQKCQREVRFLLSSEISSIYKKYGRTRKVHNLLLMPSFEDAERFSNRLDKIGNIRSDGRPILGLDSYRLLEIALESSDGLSFIPAHIWTPHFSMFGAKSGFDEIEECYEDLSSEIFAMETGLSSDPSMNWRLSVLDDYTLVSNSDAHSPPKLGREANLFDTVLSYFAMLNAMKNPTDKDFLGTIEFYPQEGKYHYDGHRKCNICWRPNQTRKHNQICPICGRTVTVGVLHRVEELADRPKGTMPESALPYQNLVPLPEIISAAVGVGVNTKTVNREYLKILSALGSEFFVLREASIDEIASVAGTVIAEGVRRVRNKEVKIRPGFDGEYGEVEIISPDEKIHYKGQSVLFDLKQEGESGKQDYECGLRNSELGRGCTQINTDKNKKKEKIRVNPCKSVSKMEKSEIETAPLNEKQQVCVEAIDGPIVVVAGPGTGKTRTLVYRIVHLIAEKSIAPSQILGVTFTNKAAEEMLSRVQNLTSDELDLSDLTIGTFHSVCLDILRAQERFENYMVFDRLDSQELIRQILSDRKIKLSPTKVLDQISLAKSKDNFDSIKESDQLFDVYEEYQARLTDFRSFDYDDILLETVRIFESDQSRLQHYREKFRQVLVDEFQDLNGVQYKLTKLLAGDGKNLFVIGDADQAIYGFRGADYRYFFKLQEDFANCKIFELEQNYRSTGNILKAATKIISKKMSSKDPDRMHVDLKTNRSSGTKIRLLETSGELAEGITIVHELSRMVGGATMLQSNGQPFDRTLGNVDHSASVLKEDRSFSDFAVLFRTGKQADILEECFLKEGIPYRLLGQKSFLKAKSVRRLLAFFRIVISEDDDFHLLNYLHLSDINKAPPKLRDLQALIEKYRAMTETLHPQTVELLFREWFEEVDLQIDRDEDKFLRIASSFNSVSDCLEKIVLYRGADYKIENEDQLEAVSLMTLHAAKGLEFPVIFIAGVEDGLIPYLKEFPTGRTNASRSETNSVSIVDAVGRASRLEERRLFYVGLTRAMEEVVLLAARRRTRYGKLIENPLSPFVDDIPKNLLKTKKIIKKRKKPEATQLTLF